MPFRPIKWEEGPYISHFCVSSQELGDSQMIHGVYRKLESEETQQKEMSSRVRKHSVISLKMLLEG